MMRAAGTLMLCAALLATSSAPVLAAAAPKARLKVVYGVKGGGAKSAYLNCAPTGGTHPNARAACRLLKQAGGDPAKLNVKPDAACTREFQPHAAVIVGTWYGKNVRWGKVYANGCHMRAATGAVLAL
ncbi:SSI family serine proteinase inhibitor [Nonomuraea sp. NPDC004580]|uniref:SSI family serine proteinase inhibitor n=1 Tax=Nonomuraea sp. NPDC004580 TaxID=3154552 RepID=UPI0033A39A71